MACVVDIKLTVSLMAIEHSPIWATLESFMGFLELPGVYGHCLDRTFNFS